MQCKLVQSRVNALSRLRNLYAFRAGCGERATAASSQADKKKPPPLGMGGGGLGAEGTKVPLFQFYQSTCARMPKPLTVAPSKPDLGVTNPEFDVTGVTG